MITSFEFGFKPLDITISSLLVLLIATEIASAIEVAPSYKEAFANYISVKSQTKDWNSNSACSTPCDISAW